MNSSPIPQTDSIQELARFWDTHDLTDFDDQLEPVTEPVFELANVIPLSLDAGEAAEIKRIAQARGIREAELIQGWVREKLAGSHPAAH